MPIDSYITNWFFVGFVCVYWLSHLPFDLIMIIKHKKIRYPDSDFASVKHAFFFISTSLTFWLTLIVSPIVFFSTGYDFLSIKFTLPSFETAVRLIGIVIMTFGLIVACLGRIGRGAYLALNEPKLAKTWGHAIVRHPEYSMYIACFIALPFATYSWFLLYLLLGINAYVKFTDMEEEELLKVFGEEYTTYQAKVGKLFPKIRLNTKSK